MTVVFRAYSPTRDQGATVTDDRQCAAGVAATRNQYTHVDDSLPADWTVQAGVIAWEDM